ncbi:acetoacetate--CoA ligase [Zhongshania aquimaris]|uniref:Acetoacetate--CoA ligase n=1 Tax=Zhongshania aquimaris TaxID=2857107 RepID=A0ABS6VTX6_9GAMM|nr:acetoacetate--CoA ligase [Zhongshania aquimaris]MBW2941765.1 acetoacetate--CoA ligase [Zhongshania aquimaris]
MAERLWQASQSRIESANITAFQKKVSAENAINISSYDDLYNWSRAFPEKFWSAVWSFCDVRSSAPYHSVISRGNTFADTQWFEGAKLNFAENLLRRRDDKCAIVSLLENGQRRSISYAELYTDVEQLAAALRDQGVSAGDRVAGIMPNIPEALIAMLATASIGAIWSSCSPDFGTQGILDRFVQIQPKVLFCSDGYYYNGKTIHSLATVKSVAERIPELSKVIVVPLINERSDLSDIPNSIGFPQFLSDAPQTALHFEQLPFNHPLYIMYSSGTTGVPKCIVHSAGGTLLQHLKEHSLHTDISANDVLFYYTTCGWMMWNWLVSGLASECTLVLYDGSPLAGNNTLLLDAIDSEGITVFGTSARYIAAVDKAGIKPRESHSLASLKTILSTGSPLSDESFNYVYRDIKADVCLSSISGGTDIISCFVLGNPILPVYSGEIQCRGLGMAVEVWDDEGNAVYQQKGELVCTAPFPSCPIGFWNDSNGEKFHDAYFATYPGIWAHSDYAEITETNGVIIHGRSDAVLNPGGVRIGTAEIYRQVEKISEVVDSVVVGQSWQSDVRVILFVVLGDKLSLDDSLIQTIKTTIRSNTTPRHVPAKIIQVRDIPRTISGKTVELAVRETIHGRPVKNTDALANPEALNYFKKLAELAS